MVSYMKSDNNCFITSIQRGLLVMICIFCSSCTPAKVDHGGFLQPTDYTNLQQVASQLPEKSKMAGTWSPMWVYYVDQGQSLAQFQSITIPDLESPIPTQKELLKEIPDAIRRELLNKKLFREVLRTKSHGGLALVGSLTREKKGEWPRALAVDWNMIQVEFKILVDEKPVGAIQAYAKTTVLGSGVLSGGIFVAASAIASAVEDGFATNVADIVAECFTGLKSGINSKVDDSIEIAVPSQMD